MDEQTKETVKQCLLDYLECIQIELDEAEVYQKDYIERRIITLKQVKTLLEKL